jgi:hypothetical protein
MRKHFALVMIALLSLMFALSAVSCAKKADETTTTTETTPPPAEMPMDTTNMMHDSTMADTSMQH